MAKLQAYAAGRGSTRCSESCARLDADHRISAYRRTAESSRDPRVLLSNNPDKLLPWSTRNYVLSIPCEIPPTLTRLCICDQEGGWVIHSDWF